ncbi:MAG: hypothetical protein ABII99_01480 [Patescibacteria group bacterium]
MVEKKVTRIIEQGMTVFNFFEGLWNIMDKAPKSVKERLPGFLGLSLEDERLFAEIRTHLTPEEDARITDFLNHCKDYERNRFRNIVAGIPLRQVKEEEGCGRTRRVKTSLQSQAVPFLKRIAKLVEEKNIDAAYKHCVSGGTILENPLHQKIFREWGEGIDWFKTSILNFFGVIDISEITPQKIKEKIGQPAYDLLGQQLNVGLDKVEWVIQKGENYVVQRKARPLWKKILWR